MTELRTQKLEVVVGVWVRAVVLNWGGFAPPAGDLWQRQSGLSLLGAATVIQWIEDAVQHLIISHTTENYPAPMSTVGFLGGAVVNGEGNGTPLQARESWGLRSSHCRAEETSPRRVSGSEGLLLASRRATWLQIYTMLHVRKDPRVPHTARRGA